MQAVIFGLFMPVMPLIAWSRRAGARPSNRQLAGRYAAYALVVNAITSAAMAFLCDENVSFWEKLDRSPSFAVKYILTVSAAAAVTAAAEWAHATKSFALSVEWKQYAAWQPVRFAQKYLFPAGLFLLCIFVVYFNSTLLRDNVLWGDEAYSANLIRNDLEGIFRVLTLMENHPPLYYLWLKLFAELFGYSGTVYHVASFVPFVIGICMAAVFFRKRFGSLPTAFFVILSGMAAPCLEYNMEIRMYALAFLGVAGSFYCAYRILCAPRSAWDKTAPWIGIVFWSLVAAYSHYYALVAVGILQCAAFAAAYVRFRGKIWIKGAVSLAAFIVAYLPWLGQVFRATESVSRNWWADRIETLGHSMEMIGCGLAMSKWVWPLLLFVGIALFLAESALFSLERKENRRILRVAAPSHKGWSSEAYAFAVGIAAIAGTLIFAYGISVLVRPLLAVRYLYPLCAVTALLLSLGVSRLLQLLGELGGRLHWGWVLPAGKAAAFLALCLLFATGMGEYKVYSARVRDEKAKTEETLFLIGDAGEGVELVNHGITHIGWTVLFYYFPEAEVVNGDYREAKKDDFWYFTPDFLTPEDMAEIGKAGYRIDGYGEKQISKYPFILYHCVR